MFLILKVGSDYFSIGLMEVVWKVVAVILNHRFTASITYHDSLHVFLAVHGTGTATPKVKILQQFTAMRK